MNYTLTVETDRGTYHLVWEKTGYQLAPETPKLTLVPRKYLPHILEQSERLAEIGGLEIASIRLQPAGEPK